jgi:hypothetical protein
LRQEADAEHPSNDAHSFVPVRRSISGGCFHPESILSQIAFRYTGRAREASWVFASKKPCPGEGWIGPTKAGAALAALAISSIPHDPPAQTRTPTAPGRVRIHTHAALVGKSLTDFGRSVMLRRPPSAA